MNKIEHNISWEEYYSLIKSLKNKIKDDANNFDQILCLARGGLFVGDALSRYLNIPLAILFTSSYRLSQTSGELHIDDNIAKQNNKFGTRILLVDDLIDSGKTFVGVSKYLQDNHDIELLKTACIWKKDTAIFTPDYFVSTSKHEDWFNQPFEVLED